MRTAAQIDKFSLSIQGNLLVRNPLQNFHFVQFPACSVKVDGLGFGHFQAGHGQVGINDRFGPLLNLLEIFWSKRAFECEIVEKPFFNGRPYGHLGSGETFFHRLGHDMRAAMTINLFAFRGIK